MQLIELVLLVRVTCACGLPAGMLAAGPGIWHGHRAETSPAFGVHGAIGEARSLAGGGGAEGGGSPVPRAGPEVDLPRGTNSVAATQQISWPRAAEERARALPYAKRLRQHGVAPESPGEPGRGSRERGRLSNPAFILGMAGAALCLWFSLWLLARRLSREFFLVNYGEVSGPFARGEVEELAAAGKLPATAFFYSRRDKTLRPISHLIRRGATGR